MAQTKNYIDAQWLDGAGQNFESTSPADGSIVWNGAAASAAQVEQAFDAARKAFGPWWDQPQDARLEIVRKFASLVDANRDELASLISTETGKPLWECKTEAAGTAGKIKATITAMQQRRDTTSFDMAGVQAVTRYKPHGVCAVLGPFNFPAHLPNGHIVPALIMGNTLVFKPSEQTPAVGAWMVEKWAEAGLPPGVLNLVQGAREVGEAVASNPQLDGMFFTGSSAVGKALHQQMAPYPQKILALELGGNNPLIVHEAKDLSAAAYLTVLSAYMSAGQRCSCARRLILVDGPESERFVETLVETIGHVSVGLPSDDPEPFLGTVISAATGQRLLAAQDDLIKQGGRPLVRMESQRNCDALLSPGLIDVTEVTNRSDEELFGPLLGIIRVPDFDAAIAEANNTAYGLSAALLSDNETLYQQFIHQIRAGVVNWNRQTTGASGTLPFGGCGLSGNHRPSGAFAVDYCSFPVASLESKTLSMPESTLPGIEL